MTVLEELPCALFWRVLSATLVHYYMKFYNDPVWDPFGGVWGNVNVETLPLEYNNNNTSQFDPAHARSGEIRM